MLINQLKKNYLYKHNCVGKYEQNFTSFLNYFTILFFCKNFVQDLFFNKVLKVSIRKRHFSKFN